MLPPQYVKPYVKTNKNNYIDAAAIVEASTRPDMHFVTVKTEQQQLLNVLYRIRQGYIRERTVLMSRIGARAMLSRPELARKAYGDWIIKLRERKPFNVALVALANKLARIIWSVMSKQEQFKVAPV